MLDSGEVAGPGLHPASVISVQQTLNIISWPHSSSSWSPTLTCTCVSSTVPRLPSLITATTGPGAAPPGSAQLCSTCDWSLVWCVLLSISPHTGHWRQGGWALVSSGHSSSTAQHASSGRAAPHQASLSLSLSLIVLVRDAATITVVTSETRSLLCTVYCTLYSVARHLHYIVLCDHLALARQGDTIR